MVDIKEQFNKALHNVDKPLNNKSEDLLYSKFKKVIWDFDSYEWSLATLTTNLCELGEHERLHRFNPYTGVYF